MIDIIGILYDQPDPEVAPFELPGWHVNITPDVMQDKLKPYLVEPSPLRRVWAGDDPGNPLLTVPLKFESEEQAIEVLTEVKLITNEEE